jgi:hypothetical protein
MQAIAMPLTKLYDTLNKAYVIPSYQRPFSWSPDKAVYLLDSIFEDAESGASLTSIGTFLFCNVPVNSGVHPFGNGSVRSNAPNTIWEVVDGQQRLTTLALIGYALRERFITLTAEGLSYSPVLEFDQFFSTIKARNGQAVPALIRDGDNFDVGYTSEIATLLNTIIGNQALQPGTTQLRKCLSGIESWIKANLNATNFGKFCSYLLTNCQYIQVEAGDQDTAFSMFEPLNSTSEPLTAFEVYRSKVTRTLPAYSVFPKTLELLNYDVATRDQVVKNSNTLIFSVAQTFSGIRPRIQFVHLKRYLDDKVDAVFIEQFESGAEFLHCAWNNQTLVKPWFDAVTKDCIKFLRAVNHEACLPLLMRYFHNNPNDIPEVVKIVVAFFGLWRPILPTNSLPEIYRGLFSVGEADNMAYVGGMLKSVAELKAYFRGKLESRLGTPTPTSTYRDIWLNPSNPSFLSYDQQKTLCRLYVLLDMGALLKSNLIPDDPWTEQDDVEHIWAVSINPSPSNLHKIGNLTFLPPAVNRSISDMDWTHKKEIYGHLAAALKSNPPLTVFADGSPLPSGVITYLANASSPALAHLQPIALSASWTEKEISDRGLQMLQNVWKTLYQGWLS